MKSGIVIEIINNKATLLMKDGTFVTVRIPKGKRPLVGNEYQTSYFSYKKRSLFALPSLSLCVSLLVAFVLLSGIIPFGNESAAAAYVSFDINPSLEVGVDDGMHVVELSAFNEEAKQLIKKHKLSIEKHPSFEAFANQLINAYEAEGYMKSDHSMLITTVASEKGNDKTEAELDQAVNSIVKQAAVKYPVAITVTETNRDTRKKAAQLGVSSGKLTAYQKANKQVKPIQKKMIKEADIQDLQKKAAVSSKDLKMIPHPRQMHIPEDINHEHTHKKADWSKHNKNEDKKEYIEKPKNNLNVHEPKRLNENKRPVHEKPVKRNSISTKENVNNNHSRNHSASQQRENRHQNHVENRNRNTNTRDHSRVEKDKNSEHGKGHNGNESGNNRHNH
ncbi:anti-sigma-I factor RsgI family protein [Fictibacillus barbaricus]|uniref:RsgI N-terminal anti-sigma domain-containing protein n=1 Tax=Fictibacillus barbaricus TaxID=182136 RepID=A0ABU1U0E2_9BACL|nr:hypothetical protein [Fictibacillus barbaricus]MDR7072939.1 hypothetical protein [Fictibacillus barbaricus]